MGGDAFENTRRLTEEEYVRVCTAIRELLEKINVTVAIPAEISDKAELCRKRGKDRPYGDVDVIVGLPPDRDRQEISKLVHSSLGGEAGVKCNDKTHSFLTKDRYQVDLMFTEPDNVVFVTAFKSNNDFGALLGHLLTPLHMKWSEKGLTLRLEVSKLTGVGTHKQDLILTDDVSEVCNFIGMEPYCLDGKTRLSSEEICEIVTTTKIFFPSKYDKKYKIKERRKKRPLSDEFFTYLETTTDDLELRKENKFPGDRDVKLFRLVHNRQIDLEEYLNTVSGRFGKEEELKAAIEAVKRGSAAKPVQKFGYERVSDWYPQLTPNECGRLLARIKSKHSGQGPKAYKQWIEETDIQEIRKEVEQLYVQK